VSNLKLTLLSLPAGDYCLGLPGGQVGKDMLNQAAVKCPNSAIFLSGYSQGGMVAHISVAYANPEAKAHVAVSRISVAANLLSRF
jgi:hypothetical protein